MPEVIDTFYAKANARRLVFLTQSTQKAEFSIELTNAISSHLYTSKNCTSFEVGYFEHL